MAPLLLQRPSSVVSQRFAGIRDPARRAPRSLAESLTHHTSKLTGGNMRRGGVGTSCRISPDAAPWEPGNTLKPKDLRIRHET